MLEAALIIHMNSDKAWQSLPLLCEIFLYHKDRQ